MTAIGCRSSATATRVRLITRNGHDWTKRYPCIVESALKNRQKHFVIDGEAVILGVDIDFSQSCRWATTLEVRPGTFVPPQLRLSVFLAIHEGKHDEEAACCRIDRRVDYFV